PVSFRVTLRDVPDHGVMPPVLLPLTLWEVEAIARMHIAQEAPGDVRGGPLLPVRVSVFGADDVSNMPARRADIARHQPHGFEHVARHVIQTGIPHGVKRHEMHPPRWAVVRGPERGAA